MASLYQSKINSILKDGARATKFGILGFNDPLNTALDKFLIVKTSQFPAIYNETTDLKYKGRSIPIKGQTRFDHTWSCTFYLNETHDLRVMFTRWIECMDAHYHDKERHSQSKLIDNYNKNISIVQYNFDGDEKNPTATYVLHNAFPKSISQIELDYSDVGRVLEYTVEFSFSHFSYSPGNELPGNLVDDLKNQFINGITGIVGAIKGNVTKTLGNVISSAKNSLTSNFSNTTSKDFSIGGAMGDFQKKIEKEGFFGAVGFNPDNFIDK